MKIKRVDGHEGWKKGFCAWSKKTWFAWQKWDGKKYVCTCEPCSPPEKKKGE